MIFLRAERTDRCKEMTRANYIRWELHNKVTNRLQAASRRMATPGITKKDRIPDQPTLEDNLAFGPAIDVNSAKTVPVRKHRRRPPRAPVAPPVVPGLVQSRETRRAAREAARMAREAAHNAAHTQACREVFGHKSDTVYLLHDHHLGIVVMPHYPPRSPVLSPNNTRGGVGPPSDGTKHHPYRLFSPYVHRWD